MTRVANALHGRQMKVGTRRRRAPVAYSSQTSTSGGIQAIGG